MSSNCSFSTHGGAEVGAAAANGLLGLGVGAAELAGRADVDAAAAQPADLRLGVERRADAPLLAPAAEADGLGHHLFLAHPHAPAAQDAVLVLLPEPLRGARRGPRPGPGSTFDCGQDASSSSRIILRARSTRDEAVRTFEPFLGRIGAGRDQPGLRSLADLHHAQPAGPVGRQPFHVAQRRDGKPEERAASEQRACPPRRRLPGR